MHKKQQIYQAATDVETLLDLGLSPVVVDYDGEVLDVDFVSEDLSQASLTTALADMLTSIGISGLGIVSYSTVAFMLTTKTQDLYDTLTVLEDNGYCIYIFQRPPKLRMSSQSVIPEKKIEYFRQKHSFPPKEDVRGILECNGVVRFDKVHKCRPIAPLPAELAEHLLNIPARRQPVVSGCFLYRQFDIFPLVIVPPKLEKLMKLARGRNRPTGVLQATLDVLTLPSSLLHRLRDKLACTVVQFQQYARLALPQHWKVSGNAGILCYGDDFPITVNGQEITMSQGDLLTFHNTEVILGSETKLQDTVELLLIE